VCVEHEKKMVRRNGVLAGNRLLKTTGGENYKRGISGLPLSIVKRGTPRKKQKTEIAQNIRPGGGKRGRITGREGNLVVQKGGLPTESFKGGKGSEGEIMRGGVERREKTGKGEGIG